MQVVLTDYVLVKLYVLLRNPAVMSQALSAKAARDLVTAYWDIQRSCASNTRMSWMKFGNWREPRILPDGGFLTQD
jgi:hypothetical protein